MRANEREYRYRVCVYGPANRLMCDRMFVDASHIRSFEDQHAFSDKIKEDDVRSLTWQEAKDLGVVMEVNRRLLHQRALALAVSTPREPRDEMDGPVHTIVLYRGGVESLRDVCAWMRSKLSETYDEAGVALWGESLDVLEEAITEALDRPDGAVLRINDYRPDSEGVYFGDLDQEDVAKAQRFDALFCADREEALGYVIEPLPTLDDVAS